MQTVSLLSILRKNTAPPYFASNYPAGDRPPSAGAGQYLFTGIAGTFGAKTGLPQYENFESQTTGAVTADSLGGTANIKVSNPDYVTVAASGAHSGSKCLKMNYVQAATDLVGISDNKLFPKVYHNYPALTKTGYLACWIKFSGGASPAVNVWKLARFNNDGGTDPYNGINSLSFTYQSPLGGNYPVTHNGQSQGDISPLQYWGTTPTTINPTTEVPLYTPATAFAPNVWHFYEIEFDAGDLNTPNAIAEQRWDGRVITRYGSGSNMTFRTTAHPGLVSSMMTPMCGIDDYSNITFLMDEVYNDGCRNRVVLTDSATYSTSTKFSIQPVSVVSGVCQWTDTAVVVNKRRGVFALGDTAYLHVFNAAGTKVFSGSGFTVTEDNVV